MRYFDAFSAGEVVTAIDRRTIAHANPVFKHESLRSYSLPLINVAVPDLTRYGRSTGIGRVVEETRRVLSNRVEFRDAPVRRMRVPGLKAITGRIDSPLGCDLLLMPRLTDCDLPSSCAVPRIVMVYDIGIVDCYQDRKEADVVGRLLVAKSFRFLRHADFVVTASNFTRSRLLRRQPELEPDRIQAIHLGVSSSFRACDIPREEARKRIQPIAKTRLRSPLLICVGTERPRKNLGLLFEAFARLKTRFPTVQLLKVGTAGGQRLRRNTDQQLKHFGLQVGTDVILLEDLSEPELVLAYRAADAFVSPSLYEGFCLPLLEAMACGISVVCVNRSAMPEVAVGAGWLAEPAPLALCENIAAALCGVASPTKVALGLVRAQELTWERAGASYLSVMNLVSGRGNLKERHAEPNNDWYSRDYSQPMVHIS